MSAGARAAPAPDDRLARLLALEAELRTARSLLAVRDEAFATLLARLADTERLVHQQAEALRRCETLHARLEEERQHAVAVATGLERSRLLRYTRLPRALYGRLLRLLGRR